MSTLSVFFIIILSKKYNYIVILITVSFLQQSFCLIDQTFSGTLQRTFLYIFSWDDGLVRECESCMHLWETAWSQPAYRAWPHYVTRRGPRRSCGKAGRTESVLFFPSTWQPYFTPAWPSPAPYPADKCPAPPDSRCRCSSAPQTPQTSHNPDPNLTATPFNLRSATQ